VIDEETVMCLPSAASVAPLRTSTEAEINASRLQTSELLCVSPLSGNPQVSLPLAEFDQVPLGLSLLSTKNSDQQLIQKAVQIMENFEK
jgi:amidase